MGCCQLLLQGSRKRQFCKSRHSNLCLSRGAVVTHSRRSFHAAQVPFRLALNLSEGRKSGGKTDPKGRIPHQQANRTKLPEQYTRPSFLTLPGVKFPSARWRKDGFCYHDRLRLDRKSTRLN